MTESPPPIRPLPGSGALGGTLVHLDRTTSTNDRARELALSGAPAGTVVVAEEQSAGRGRQGRTWSAPRGRALTLSAIVRLGAPRRALSLLPLATALAVCEACEDGASVSCLIKWPNDVLVRDRKLAGILIESRPQDRWAVVGIGLNVNTTEEDLAPELSAAATSLLIEAGQVVDRGIVLRLLLDRLGTRLAPLSEDGAGSLLEAYRKRDALRGRRISWTSRDTRLAGEAHGIDVHGRLVVLADSGERLALDAGEVHLVDA